MAIAVTCGSCGQRFKAPDTAAGRKARCPVCQNALVVPAGPAAAEVEAGPPEVGPEKGPARRSNGLGVASLVLGVIALLIAWVPGFGLAALPLGAVGAVLGAVLAARGTGRAYGTALAGLILNVAGAVVAVVVTTVMARAMSLAVRQAEAERTAVVALARAEVAKSAPRPAPPPAAGGPLAGLDANGDGRLNADEVPAADRARFAAIDADGDGYADADEWARASRPAPAAAARGPVMARRVITAADDFVVDVFHNGTRVPDAQRAMVGESYGATSEKVDVEVREGDWLVFNVANNRLRWDGASYFGAAGVNDTEPKIAFTTERTSGRWSYCDDPGRAPRFIAERDYLAGQAAKAPANPWPGGDDQMKQHAPGWAGTPVWGERRNTWIKFVARPGPVPVAAAGTAPAARTEPEPEPKAAPTPEKPAAPKVTLRPRATLKGHPGLVYNLAFTADGKTLVSCSASGSDPANPNRLSSDPGTLIAWDVAKARGRTGFGRENSITSFGLNPRRKAVAVADGGNVALFDLGNGRPAGTLAGPPQTSVQTVAVSPDGKLAAAGYTINSDQVLVWNLSTGRPVATLRGSAGAVVGLAFAPDGKQLASGTDKGTVLLWDLGKKTPQSTLPPASPDSPASCLAYAPDGGTLGGVVGSVLQFWDTKTGAPREVLHWDERFACHGLAYSADGRRLVTASGDYREKEAGPLLIWDAATGQKLGSAVDPDGAARAAAFSPDGKTLASTSGKLVKLWDVAEAP